MKTIITLLAIVSFSISFGQENYKNKNFDIQKTSVTHHKDLSVTVWSISVKGTAGQTTPKKNGSLDGAPVLGYVFSTTLKPTDVGFNQTEGIVALALTSHPDFDDTPL